MNRKAVAVLILSICVFILVIPIWEKPKPRPKPVKSGVKPSKNTKPIKHEFGVEVLKVEETGTLSRRITAKLINEDGFAKNVTVTLELILDGKTIEINGKKRIELYVGNMRPNESVCKTLEISVGFFDGLKIKSKGYVVAKLTIRWDNGTDVFRRRISV